MDALASPAAPVGSPAEFTGDRRLSALADVVDAGTHEVLSLDVFDTFVWRRVPRPTDAFFVLAERLISSGALWPGCPPEAFVLERTSAEQRARRATPGRECTLASIWREFPAGFLRGTTAEQAMAMELDVERELVVVDPGMRALAERARARGMKVAFVSDTYFTGAQVREFVGFPADAVVASCEHGRSKVRGLHAVLLAELGVSADRVLHVGDHPVADVEGPGQLGLDRYWLRAWPDPYEQAMADELPDAYTPRGPLVRDGDDGRTALRRRAMFACDDEYERWGAGVLGPVLAGFADWTAARSRAIGARVVWCLMREGRVLRRVLEASGAALDARECFVSRHAARRAGVIEASERELLALFRRPSPPSRAKLLAEIGLAPEDVGAHGEDATLNDAGVRWLAARVANDARLRARAREACARVRAGLVAHLRTLLPSGDGPIAVVDLGYAGTIQACLERVMAHEGLGRTHGLYLVTGSGAHVAQETGAPCEGYLASNGQPVAIAHTFLRSPEVVEQSLMADCGTTIAHAPDGTPVTGEVQVPAEQRRAIEAIQRGVLRWVSLWRAFAPADRAAAAERARGPLRAILARLVARPSDLELELFGDWQHDENFGSDRVRALAEPDGLHDWERTHLSPHQLASLPSSLVYWPCGWAHRLGRETGEQVASLFLRGARAEALHAAAGRRALAVQWDEGDGFTADRGRVEEVALGPAGRTWHRVRMQLQRATHRRWALTLGVRGDVIELAGVRVHRRPEDGEPDVRDLPAAQLERIGWQPMGGALWRATGDAPAVIVPAEGVQDFTGEIWLDVFLTDRGRA